MKKLFLLLLCFLFLLGCERREMDGVPFVIRDRFAVAYQAGLDAGLTGQALKDNTVMLLARDGDLGKIVDKYNIKELCFNQDWCRHGLFKTCGKLGSVVLSFKYKGDSWSVYDDAKVIKN